MNLTSLQQAKEQYDQLSPQERLSMLRADIAYLELLELDHAPTLTISAQPDNPLVETIELTIASDEFLTEVKALLINRLEKLCTQTAKEFRQAGIPKGCTTSDLEFCPGVTVTIVHSGPRVARSEAEVVLD